MARIIIKISFSLSLILFFIFPQTILANSDYSARRTEQSHVSIAELTPTQTIEFWVKFKNTGSKHWGGIGLNAVELRAFSGAKNKFSHTSWYNSYTPNRVNPALTIYTDDYAMFRFTVIAPRESGMYWEKFNLFAGSTPIPGGDIEIGVRVIDISTELLPETEVPIPVQEPLPEAAPPSQEAPAPKQLYWQTIPAEINIVNNIRWPGSSDGPKIRAGLLYVEPEEQNDYLPFQISTLNNSLYNIYDKNNKLLVRNTAGEQMEIDYDYSIDRYFINDSFGKRILMTDSYLKFKGSNNTIFKINSWKNGPFWGQDVNDNEFRYELEIQYNPNTDRLWLINQLPIEEYLKGVAEVSDLASPEFLKVQIIAARTYALFRYITPKYINTPTGEPLFTVRSTQADQVYRGYSREQRATNTVLAVGATKGIVATYQGEPILAYYFAQSNGNTLSSYEGKMTRAPVDYLQSKIDPPGQGKDMRGHGVGLPQTSGMAAANEGANYSQILKYYYTGIDLTKMY